MDEALNGLGSVRVHQRRFRDAIALHEEAAAVVERIAPEHPQLTIVLVPLGDAYLAAGRKADAVAALERAVAIGEKKGAGIPALARARFHLARALWATAERTRALALARAAREQLAGTPNRRDLDEVERWLRRTARAASRAQANAR
jgi:eukaryotic-like serine/threonine-protein kinase